MNIIDKASNFAAHAHRDHKRKYTGLPYFVHLESVAAMVAKMEGTEAMVAAAYLHDTVEDTAVTIIDIENNFGTEIASLVLDLTDQFTKEAYPALNRRARKERERARMANMSNDAKTIKLADLIDNSWDITVNDPNFAKVYLEEKKLLLPALEGGNAKLMKVARVFTD